MSGSEWRYEVTHLPRAIEVPGPYEDMAPGEYGAWRDRNLRTDKASSLLELHGIMRAAAEVKSVYELMPDGSRHNIDHIL